MKRTYIRKVSDKQKEINKLWNEVTQAQCEKRGFFCQWCGHFGHRNDRESLLYLDGHHIQKRRFGNHTKENCFICHRSCHQHIHSKGIDVSNVDK